MKERGSQTQQSILVQLAGTGGPTELVIVVAPYMTADEDRNRQVWNDDPQQGVHRRPPMYSGGAKGSSPTSSAGGPLRARSSARSRSAGAGSGSTHRTRSSTSTYGDPASASAIRSSSTPARCSRSSSRPASGARAAA